MNGQGFAFRIMVIAVMLWLLASMVPPAMAHSTFGAADSDTANKPAWCSRITRRIHFRFGSFRGAVRGFLNPTCTNAFFILRARAGQRMRILLTSAGPAAGTVIFPNGSASGQPVGTRGAFFDGILPFTGDYRIQISESQMAQFWFGSFGLNVLIV